MEKQPERIFDEWLVLRCQGGDAEALEQLVRRWQPRLRRHAWRLLQGDDVVVDILQEAWLAIVRGLGRLEDPASFPKWAYRIVSNKCADYARRQQRHRQAVQELASDHSQRRDDREETENQDAVDLLRVAMRRMNGDRLAILSMFYQEDMSLAQISHAMNIPVGTVKSRLFHARRELREAMARSRDSVRELDDTKGDIRETKP